MEVGIIGLPFSGKTTVFTTLTGLAPPAKHVSGKVEIHRGVVEVPDSRLNNLSKIFKPKKTTHASIEYIEVGGVEKEPTGGKGFDPNFLAVLKNTDALCHVVRAFENEVYPHPEGTIDPLRDVRFVEVEFILSDLSIVENRISRLQKQIQKTKSEEALHEMELMHRCREMLEDEKPLRELEFTEEEEHKIRGYQFLSAKPVIVVVNYGEQDISNEEQLLARLEEYENKPQVAITGLSAKVEMEISQLEEPDRQLFLEEMNISEPALHKLIHKTYHLLGYISFFTIGDEECRAWTITRHTPVKKAAGMVHSDMERGFIRAEVVNYEDFIKMGSLAACRQHGILRVEGKDYPVQDGDLVIVRFNV